MNYLIPALFILTGVALVELAVGMAFLLLT